MDLKFRWAHTSDGSFLDVAAYVLFSARSTSYDIKLPREVTVKNSRVTIFSVSLSQILIFLRN